MSIGKRHAVLELGNKERSDYLLLLCIRNMVMVAPCIQGKPEGWTQKAGYIVSNGDVHSSCVTRLR